jgi:transcriptional regulator with XRE-family HTH domain
MTTAAPPTISGSPAGTLAEQVGRLFAASREATGLSRRALAQELGIADTTLLEIEHGRANPTLGRLAALADGYGLEVIIEVRPKRRAPKVAR